MLLLLLPLKVMALLLDLLLLFLSRLQQYLLLQWILPLERQPW